MEFYIAVIVLCMFDTIHLALSLFLHPIFHYPIIEGSELIGTKYQLRNGSIYPTRPAESSALFFPSMLVSCGQ